MKKLFFFSFLLFGLFIISCTKNSDIQDELTNNETLVEETTVFLNENDGVTSRAAPCQCRFEYQVLPSGSSVNICGPWCRGSVTCSTNCTSGSTRTYSSTNGVFWNQEGTFGVSNPGLSTVTFRLRKGGTSTWTSVNISSGGLRHFVTQSGCNFVFAECE